MNQVRLHLKPKGFEEMVITHRRLTFLGGPSTFVLSLVEHKNNMNVLSSPQFFIEY